MISRYILVVLVGLVIFVTLLDGSTLPVRPIKECPLETSLPCILGYPEIQEVCFGQSASANITLRLPQVFMKNLTLTHVKVLVRDQEFSHGTRVKVWYNGGESFERWKIKLMFDRDTMIYEVKNAKIKFWDEFVCHLELDIRGQKFKSDPFQWFGVENCIPPTKPSATEKTEFIQRAVNCSDQLSEMHELLGNVKTKLDTLEVVVLVLLFLLTAKIFIPLRVQKDLQKKLSGILNRIRCNKLPSSSTFDHSTVRSQSSSGFASRNQDESSPNKEAKPLLQGDTESMLDLNPSDHCTVRSQSFSGFASRNQVDSSPNKEAKPLLQEDTESLLNLNPSDEDRKIPDAIQKYTNGRPSTEDEQHCKIEMIQIK